jgi:hypothetical protein
MGATTYEADNSHLVMLSNPGLVTDVIRPPRTRPRVLTRSEQVLPARAT